MLSDLPHGKGMSKSKGNVVWADELLRNYAIDSFRYWVGTAKWGSDIPFKEKELVAGKRFLTKLWNASRFVLINLPSTKKPKKIEVIDKWILSELSSVVEKATKNFDVYKTEEAKKVIEQFFWHTFCDNYLEIIKDRLYNKKRSKQEKESARYTLYIVLFAILKLIAPIMPHITEEIYQSFFKKYEKVKSIHISEWPKINKKLIDKRAEKIGDATIEIVTKVRQFKSKAGKSLKTEILLTLDKKRKKTLKDVLADLKAVTNAREIKSGKFSVKF